ncbi:hypothetical protein [Nostoc sp.]
MPNTSLQEASPNSWRGCADGSGSIEQSRDAQGKTLRTSSVQVPNAQY